MTLARAHVGSGAIREDRMAKKKKSRRKHHTDVVQVSPRQLSVALREVAHRIEGVRRIILKLPPTTRIMINLDLQQSYNVVGDEC